MISSYLMQKFGEPMHAAHSSAAKARSLQTVDEDCLLDTCISTCLAPELLHLDDVQLEPVRWAHTTSRLPHAPFVTCFVHAMGPVSLVTLSSSAMLHVSLASCHQNNLNRDNPSAKVMWVLVVTFRRRSVAGYDPTDPRAISSPYLSAQGHNVLDVKFCKLPYSCFFLHTTLLCSSSSMRSTRSELDVCDRV